jgi:D-amino-acid oxidase
MPTTSQLLVAARNRQTGALAASGATASPNGFKILQSGRVPGDRPLVPPDGCLSGAVPATPDRHRWPVGGTEEPGRDSRAPDPAAAARIIEACAAIRPELRDATVVDHRVGLRPVRPSVRLESEQGADGITVVHSYGHGGAGVTLSWGCAEDTVGLVLAVLG